MKKCKAETYLNQKWCMKVYLNDKKTCKDPYLQNDILWGFKALFAIPSNWADYDHHIATSPLPQIIRPTYAPENCYNMAEVLFAIQIRIRWQFLPSVEVIWKSL